MPAWLVPLAPALKKASSAKTAAAPDKKKNIELDIEQSDIPIEFGYREGGNMKKIKSPATIPRLVLPGDAETSLAHLFGDAEQTMSLFCSQHTDQFQKPTAAAKPVTTPKPSRPAGSASANQKVPNGWQDAAHMFE